MSAFDTALAGVSERHGPVEEHPAKGSIHAVQCRYAWAFYCEHRDRKGGRCDQRRVVRCNGGQHIRLDDAVTATIRFGWEMRRDGAHPGWRCLDHREQPERRAQSAEGA